MVSLSLVAGAASPAGASTEAGVAEQLTSTTLVSGTVVNGTAPLAGAKITPVVWPNSDVTSALADGADVPVMTLPAVTSTSTGNFMVNLDPSTLSSTYLDSKGRPQIELMIVGNGKYVTWDFTAVRSHSGWATTKSTQASDGGAGTAETLVADLGSKPTITEVDGDNAISLSSGKMSPADAQAVGDVSYTGSMPASAAGDAACVRQARSWLYDRQEPFAHVYPGRTAAEWIVQNFGTDHTLGIAISYNGGAWGGGSAGGSKTISLSASGSVRLTANSTAFNSLNFRQYYETCGTGYTLKWEVDSVHGILTRIDAAAEPNFTVCDFYGPGFTVTKYRGTNVTYRSEVNVAVANVNAQSGWNSSTEVYWKTGGTRNGICGSTSLGWASSPEAEANSA
jgi:hypothetical protein